MRTRPKPRRGGSVTAGGLHLLTHELDHTTKLPGRLTWQERGARSRAKPRLHRRGAYRDRDGWPKGPGPRSGTGELERLRKRRLVGRPAWVLLYLAGPALLLGGAYVARLRSDLADRAD